MAAKPFDYMMLSRLESDCKYFLGFGGRNAEVLFFKDVDKHISEMRNLYNSFNEDEKPEWISLEKIEEYENAMKVA